ncbi:MAG: COX15/CtaA family protein [Acidimicrobiales bacterium]
MTPARYRQITGMALMALAVIVVTGTAVRLTESGLGCSDWPTCEENQLIADFSLHPMIEFINRVFTGFVAVAVMVAVLGSLFRTPRRADLTWLSLGLVAGVIGQIVLGAFVVKSHLNPWLVLNHFLLSMVLVANATVLHARAGYDPVPRPRSGRPYRWPITILTIAAIIAGTFVTGSGPHTGSYDGDNIERLPFDVPDIARVHGGIVIALVLVVIATMWHLNRTGAPEAEQWRCRLVLASLILQAGIGYTQYFTGVPVLLVGFHILGATLTWIAILWFHLDTSPEPDELGDKRGMLADEPSILVS